MHTGCDSAVSTSKAMGAAFELGPTSDSEVNAAYEFLHCEHRVFSLALGVEKILTLLW